MASTTVTERSPATHLDLEALPEGVKGEIIDGVLYTQPRPRFAHQSALAAITADLHGPFQRGRGGPGDWWILPEPGITLPGAPEFSPDIAGWRRKRMPEPPVSRIDLVPDWICEILSPSTRQYDLTVKKRFYAKSGVPFIWYVDVESRTLQVSALEGGRWLELGAWREGEHVRAAPFDELELELGAWWCMRDEP